MPDFFTFVDEEYSEESEKTESTGLMDIITILSWFKCYDQIEKNGMFFYGIYRWDKSKKYLNLEQIKFIKEELPVMNEADGSIKLMKLDISGIRFIVQYLSYNQESFNAAFGVNKIIDVDTPMVFKLLEKILPRRKLFIKNLSKKKEIPEKLLSDLMNFLNISKKVAIDYIETAEICGFIDYFIETFDDGEKSRKEIKNKKSKDDEEGYETGDEYEQESTVQGNYDD